jgi:hypothetical protein
MPALARQGAREGCCTVFAGQRYRHGHRKDGENGGCGCERRAAHQSGGLSLPSMGKISRFRAALPRPSSSPTPIAACTARLVSPIAGLSGFSRRRSPGSSLISRAFLMIFSDSHDRKLAFGRCQSARARRATCHANKPSHRARAKGHLTPSSPKGRGLMSRAPSRSCRRNVIVGRSPTPIDPSSR